VGSLIYLTTTRPDISFIVGILFRFMQKPCEGNWCDSKRVLRYLKGTRDFQFKYSKVEDLKLAGYTNSYLDGDKENGVFTSICLMSLGSTTISWISHKQAILADSTTEAVYVVSTEATKESVWIRKILKDLQEKQVNAPPL
jgi:hypothetical protein